LDLSFSSNSSSSNNNNNNNLANDNVGDNVEVQCLIVTAQSSHKFLSKESRRSSDLAPETGNCKEFNVGGGDKVTFHKKLLRLNRLGKEN